MSFHQDMITEGRMSASQKQHRQKNDYDDLEDAIANVRFHADKACTELNKAMNAQGLDSQTEKRISKMYQLAEDVKKLAEATAKTLK